MSVIPALAVITPMLHGGDTLAVPRIPHRRHFVFVALSVCFVLIRYPFGFLVWFHVLESIGTIIVGRNFEPDWCL